MQNERGSVLIFGALKSALRGVIQACLRRGISSRVRFRRGVHYVGGDADFFQECVVELSHGVLLILRFICIYYSLLYADRRHYFCPITHYYNGTFAFFVK